MSKYEELMKKKKKNKKDIEQVIFKSTFSKFLYIENTTASANYSYFWGKCSK